MTPVTETLIAESSPPPRAGWRVVARKELADHILSARFAVLLALLALVVTGTVYAVAGAIREVAPDASGVPSLFLKLFTIAPQQLIPPFFSLVGFLAPLLGIAFGFDAVNSERSEGTLPRLLSQPIHRDDVINGKFAAGLGVIGLILASITVMVSGIGMVRLGIVPSADQVARLVAWLVVAVIYVGFWLALATLLSVAVRRAATSALISIAGWLVFTLFFGLLAGLVTSFLAPAGPNATNDEVIRNARLELAVNRISPATLYEEATVVLLDPEVRTVGILLTTQLDRAAVRSELSFGQSLLLSWPQVVGLLALTAIEFAAAYVLFLRQEVRA